MSSKHDVAVVLENLLTGILGYEIDDPSNPEKSIKEGRRASNDNICADSFDCVDNISDLRNAITKVIKSLSMPKNEKQSLIGVVNELETLQFEQVAEYWLLIVKLLSALKRK